MRPAALLAAALLAAAGCGRQPAAPSDFRARKLDPAAAREWLAGRGQPDAAAKPAAPAWTEPAKLPPLEIRPLPIPEGEPPAKPAEIVARLKSRKANDRILGLVGAWRVRPPEAREALAAIAAADDAFSPQAVQVLARYADPAGAQALLAALGSRSALARLAAAQGLGARRAGAGGPVEAALVRAARRDRDWRVRAAAARAAGLSAGGPVGPAAEVELERLMRDPAQPLPVSLECAAALARSGVDSGWGCLREGALAAEGGATAILALELAGEVGGRRGAALLGAALQSPRAEVWTAAARAFRQVGRADALVALSARLKAGGEAGQRAALALAPHEGRALLAELAESLDRGSSVVRAAACGALALAAGGDAAAALERKLLDAGEVGSVRCAAAAALGSAGGPLSARALKGVADDDPDETVRAAARDALRLVEARLARGAEAVDEAAAERFAFLRWELREVLPGRPPAGCRLADENGAVRVYRHGDAVAMGYRLTRVLCAGEEAGSAEVLMAGRGATRTDLLRAILTKGDRAVVLLRQAVQGGK